MNLIDELDLIEIPEGEFIMGANTYMHPKAKDNQEDWGVECNEEPRRKIWLSTYKIQRTPVTINLWKQFLESTGYDWHFQSTLNYFYQETANISPSDLCPITFVSWFDAVEFTNWLTKTLSGSYSLPTEAQWEKACRGECGQLYPWGSEDPEDWYTLPPLLKTPIPVVKRLDRQSPYGCLDMWQNISEWSLDWYNEEITYDDEQYYFHNSPNRKYYYNNDPNDTVNPQGAKTGEYRIFRGGNFLDSAWPRCSYRGFQESDFRYDFLGFRVVLNL